MGSNGSPEFALTWREVDMPSGVPICALRASAHRTGDNGCSGSLAGWATPDTVPDAPCMGTNAVNQIQGLGNQAKSIMTGWPTPTSRDHKDGDAESCQNVPVNALLGRTANLVPLATPRAEDAESAGMRHNRDVADTLSAQAGQDLAAWPTPNAMEGGQKSRGGDRKGEKLMGGLVALALATGETSPPSPAGTEKRAALNPNLSRWLMGFPLSWTLCGLLAHLKSKSKPRSPRSRSPRPSPVASPC